MATITGKDMTVTFADGYTPHALKWRIEDEATMLEDTSADTEGEYEEFATGWKRWSGSYECIASQDTALPTSGTSGAATFLAHSGRTYAGSIIVRRVIFNVEVGGGRRHVGIEFQGNGALSAT